MDTVDLSDLALFANGAPHEIFRQLRREVPVYANPAAAGPPFWAVTRHADVVAVSRDSDSYSSERAGIMIFDESFESSGRERMMIELDPPRHTRFRALVNQGFTPRNISRLRSFVTRRFDEVLDVALDKGCCDFVGDVAAQLPLQVIAELVGVPDADRPQLGALAHRIQGFDDPEMGGGTGGENSAAIAEMADYALRLARDRLTNPQDDIATTLLHAEIDGERLDAPAFAAFFILLITAGIETTMSALSGAMLAFVEHPEQWQRLADDPTALPGAREEVLRWTSPIYHFRRTALRETELAGVVISEGDRVVVWYSSANRDESVFPAADRFDIGRDASEHLAFGHGRHFCLGAGLARLELDVGIGRLLERGVRCELRGEPEYLRSNFTSSLKRLPVELRA